ncbi:MAG: sporulation protein YqfD [Clostridia bacterium]|nr:sporulation protein YqfD [Clostridia bacterium]
MLFSQFICYLKGYLVVQISGRFPERFLNVCAARGIYVWDIVRLSESTIRLKISIRGFKMLRHSASKTGVRLKILAKCGLPITLNKHKGRKMLLGGIIIFMLGIMALNLFIWDIEIVGNNELSKAVILKNLEECGLSIGKLRFNIDQKKLKNDMLIKTPSLSWLWAEKRGSKIIVSVKEKKAIPEIFNADDYCSLVAAKDGVIHSMIVRNGLPVVKIGDSVQKNSLLVSGVISSERNVPTRYLNADGEIYARTWYEITKAFSKIHTVKEKTDNILKKYSLTLFGKRINFYKNPEPDFTEYEKTEKDYELSLFKNYLGITLTVNTFNEVKLVDTLLSEDAVIADGIRKIEEEIDLSALPDSELVKTTPSYNFIDDDTIEITVVAEYIENIAQKVKMEKPEEELLPQANEQSE